MITVKCKGCGSLLFKGNLESFTRFRNGDSTITRGKLKRKPPRCPTCGRRLNFTSPKITVKGEE